jgi:hypothetical protein
MNAYRDRTQGYQTYAVIESDVHKHFFTDAAYLTNHSFDYVV